MVEGRRGRREQEGMREQEGGGAGQQQPEGSK